MLQFLKGLFSYFNPNYDGTVDACEARETKCPHPSWEKANITVNALEVRVRKCTRCGALKYHW